ncbi:class I SAM-dependent methyltransferase [Chitinophaga lutea]|uniref:Class I SAM-dependent methyltransferase n=1 Tax=Chitinophaga lutea TaxID=2488634 RepID=A0A3N4PZL4_9BACT|nr:class I SAM-dependent methyltransferase [Chitinophaga lutea]RPE09477.1 class I SAM-dependent methyltransferase [Chitinophaga lutea]
MNFFTKETKTALQAKEQALWLAFAPIAFQASKALRDLGILKVVADSGTQGVTIEDILEKVKLSRYSARVLLEAGLGLEMLIINDKRYTLTKTGFFILNDTLTRINMDFSADVCYKAMYHLQDSLTEGKPLGLKELGEWETIYPGLSLLPEPARTSWFNFDHYYSDLAFPAVLPIVFEQKPKKLLDIGGNTGKWSMACARYNEDVHVTIVDLPAQVNVAKKNIAEAGLEDRIDFYITNILDESQPFAQGYDVIWMSQFLDCFSEAEIISILRRCREALNEGGSIFILEPFWNKQQFKSAAFCLQQTSLYFTAIANGNSQMYHTDDFFNCIRAAGLEVVLENNDVGLSYTLLRCVKA